MCTYVLIPAFIHKYTSLSVSSEIEGMALKPVGIASTFQFNTTTY